MTPEQFTYWLKGFLELSGNSEGLTPEQVTTIKEQLNLVLDSTTPVLNESTWVKQKCSPLRSYPEWPNMGFPGLYRYRADS